MTSVRVTHIGGPTTLIDVGGWRLLTCDLGRRRGPIDAVLLTHDHHGDNLDVAGRHQPDVPVAPPWR
jgi:L-ascorbate metabolism protein UlaG (beta-lactamase superfamily)